MKKLTKAERKKVYLSLARKVYLSKRAHEYICHLLWEIINKKPIDYFFE